jgi:type II secretory pathway predicted ATPase ExeA
MYEQFFQLQRRPFAATPDPACFISSEPTAELLNQLTVCVEHGQGIGILTAPAGMGKTLLCKRLVRDLGDRYRCIFLGNSNFPTRRSLLQAILLELGAEPSRKDEQELRHELRSTLGEIRHDYEALVLVVDEAHLFEAAVLEEIRTLVDFADEGHSLVRVILSGQLELEERMTDRQFDAINQRMSAHVYVEALSIAESVGYIRHRIEWAGGNPDEVISEEGILIVARASCGVPRCLNQLADHSLLLGFAADESPVSESTVREALEDLKQLPLHWNDVNDADRMIESNSESASTVDVGSPDDEAKEMTGQTDVAHPVESPGSDEAEAQQNPQPESHIESTSSESAAPIAVFEFGGDDPPSVDDDEGETLDEVAAGDEVAVTLSDDLSLSNPEQVQDAGEAAESSDLEFGLSGRPSPPVSEICGVVLDLTAEVSGVSEYHGSNVKSDQNSDRAESDDETEVSGESADASAEESHLDTPDASRSEVAEEVTKDAGANATAVFEFGVPEDETESASAEDVSAEDETEVAAAESERDAESEREAETVGESSDEAAPTEEEVLAEITSVEREIAQVTAEFDLDSEPAADADPVVVLDEDSMPAESAELTATDTELETAGEVESEVTASDPAFEFEIVSDPYSLIQEPLAAGIDWNVPAATETDSVSENEKEETADESCDVAKPAVVSAESVAEEEVAAEDCEPVAESSSENTAESVHIESEETILELSGEPLSEEFGEAIMRDWVEDSSGQQDEELDVVESPSAELSLFEAETGEFTQEDTSHDDAEFEPHGVREIHPDRLIGAIVPMLGEIDDQFTAESQLADRPERAAVDIEAELVEAISVEDAELEDEIGAAVLDMCLDTQWSLQQDRGESCEESSEASGQASHSHFDDEPDRYDIVEPEEATSTGSFLDQVSEISRDDLSEPDAADGAHEARRPFGRLFSDLRRREL